MRTEEKSGAIETINFVLNVLKQHENDLDRLILQLDIIVDKVGVLTDKMALIIDEFSQMQETKRALSP
jgi:hypothetical protein